MVNGNKIKLLSNAKYDRAWEAAATARRAAEKLQELAEEDILQRQERLHAIKARSPRRRMDKAKHRAAVKGSVPQRWKRSECPDELCYWCGVGIDETTDEVDHIMPIGLYGPAEPYNEAWVCRDCNSDKLDKHPLVWLAQLVSA